MSDILIKLKGPCHFPSQSTMVKIFAKIVIKKENVGQDTLNPKMGGGVDRLLTSKKITNF